MKTKLDTTSQQNRLALECRVSALADISQSFADAVYQHLDTCFLNKIIIVQTEYEIRGPFKKFPHFFFVTLFIKNFKSKLHHFSI
jgi:hypothetical protein